RIRLDDVQKLADSLRNLSSLVPALNIDLLAAEKALEKAVPGLKIGLRQGSIALWAQGQRIDIAEGSRTGTLAEKRVTFATVAYDWGIPEVAELRLQGALIASLKASYSFKIGLDSTGSWVGSGSGFKASLSAGVEVSGTAKVLFVLG